MNVKQLENVLNLADEYIFFSATEKVNRTQPSLSQHIKKIEKGSFGNICTWRV